MKVVSPCLHPDSLNFKMMPYEALIRDVVFGGRLAQYKYYDMAPVIEQVMKLWNII